VRERTAEQDATHGSPYQMRSSHAPVLPDWAARGQGKSHATATFLGDSV
jgi:hypothetical protein